MKKGLIVAVLLICFVVIIGLSFFKLYSLAGGMSKGEVTDEKDLIWVWFMIG